MRVKETYIKGCFLLKPTIFEDARGTFFESYNKAVFDEILGAQITFVQDNHSVSHKGTLRGLHYQKEPYAQSKLIRVLHGQILDVMVDLRKTSATYGQHLKIRLSAEDNEILFMPKGMAHGFLTLSEKALFAYKCDAYYNKEAEGGIIYNDPDLNIDWEYPESQIILSKKDSQLPTFKNSPT